MPKNKNIKKVLVIGSGPIIIGQAAEFDYAGTQACRALKEEGVEVILINSNPATIMTDKDIADKVYIEPLTVPVVKHLIEVEKPDSLLPTLGGQNALNIAMALTDEGFLEKHHVQTIGTSTKSIKLAEDRLEFKKILESIHEPLFLWAKMNNGINTTKWLEKTLSNGVVFVPGEFFYCNEPDHTTLRMSFVTPTDEQLKEAVRRLKISL